MPLLPLRPFAPPSLLSRSLAALGATVLLSATLGAQQPTASPAKPATYTGCVTKATDASQALVLSNPNVCAVLKGKLDQKGKPDQLAGHTVELKGILQPATSTVPATIQVDTVQSVGQACSDTCSLHPPASRGLTRPKGSVVPGSEGGTPGETQQPQSH